MTNAIHTKMKALFQPRVVKHRGTRNAKCVVVFEPETWPLLISAGGLGHVRPLADMCYSKNRRRKAWQLVAVIAYLMKFQACYKSISASFFHRC